MKIEGRFGAPFVCGFSAPPSIGITCIEPRRRLMSPIRTAATVIGVAMTVARHPAVRAAVRAAPLLVTPKMREYGDRSDPRRRLPCRTSLPARL